MRLSDLSIDRPVATVMLLVSLMVLGTVALFRLPLDFMPMVEEPEIDVNVPFPGSHPLEALRQVALPLEEELATIADVKSIEASAGEVWWASGSHVEVEVRFDWSVDLELKKLAVRDAVERVRPLLPDGIGHIEIVAELDGPGGGTILQGRISAERDLSESWDLLERRMKRPLERQTGVARVDLYGVEPQEVRVDLDLDALRRHGVAPEQVIARVRAANVEVDAGSVRGDVKRYDVRTTARFRDVGELRALVVGGGLRLGDVARVERREPELPYGRHLNRQFAIGFDVFKEPTANTVATVDRLLARIAEFDRDPQLDGVTVLIWNNAGQEIRSSLGGLRNAGLTGGVLAVAVLFLFLRRVATTLIVAVAIPFSLLVTCGAMYLLDSQFNVLTLLGLMFGVGMLVDNAVVVIENIYRRQGQGMEPREAARRGAREVSLAVLAATATTILVWSWLFVSERSELTIYMGAVAMTICLAVACSLLVSLTFIPLAAARFAPRRGVGGSFLVERVVPRYRRLVAWTLRHRLLTLLGLVLLAGSAVVPVASIEKSGEPKMMEQAVSIHYEIKGAMTKERMERNVDVVEDWVFSRQHELGFDSVYSWYNQNGWGNTNVYLPRSQATPDNIARLRQQLQTDPPVLAGVKLRIGERDWWRRGKQGRRMVAVALHGEDPEYLEELALGVEERLRTIPGVLDVWGPSLQGQKEVRIRVDPDRARALDLTPARVAATVAMAFRGRRLGRLRTGDDELDIVLGLPDDAQPGLAALVDLPIPTAPGDDATTVPLGSVADLVHARTESRIEREDRQTTDWVSVELDADEYTTADGRELVRERLRGLVLPEGYSWDFGSWGRDHDDTLATMLEGVVLSMLVVVLLMASLFESLTQPLAILITLPLAFFGGFWALWLGGYELDAVGFMGVIVLIGIVVNNGIVMVDHVNRLRRRGTARVEALSQGAGDRLRPVLMTAITTLFGLLPLALSAPTVAGAYIDSLAVVVIGGLLSSTVFTLVALPVWYATVEDVGALLRRSLPRRRRAADLSPAGEAASSA